MVWVDADLLSAKVEGILTVLHRPILMTINYFNSMHMPCQYIGLTVVLHKPVLFMFILRIFPFEVSKLDTSKGKIARITNAVLCHSLC